MLQVILIRLIEMFKRLVFKARGFTLIEALVALLVLSVGLVGLAMMQVKAMQSSHVAYQRSVATIAAQDMVERLWIELGRSAPASIVCPEATDVVADSDPEKTILEQWHDRWVQKIPGLTMNSSGTDDTVIRSSPSDSDYVRCKYTITVRWQDERFDGEDVSELVYIASLIGEES